MTATYILIENALHSDALKASSKNVFIYLAQRANKKLECFPGIRTIAEILKVSVSTVKRAIRELVEQGFIKRLMRFRKDCPGQTSNLYILMQDPKPVPKETKYEDVSLDDEKDAKKEEASVGADASSNSIDKPNIDTTCIVSQAPNTCQSLIAKNVEQFLAKQLLPRVAALISSAMGRRKAH